MIPCRSLALCALLAAAVPVFPRELRCAERQYLFQERCCSDCAPGERMRSRCTATSDTVCAPCQAGYFSPEHHHGFCRSCTVCNPRKGSVEVKRCERSSDRVCACRAGFSPSGSPLGSECSRCPEGTFSRGGNELCQPWTNCSRRGQRTLRAGSGTEDSVCGDPDGSGDTERGPIPAGIPGNVTTGPLPMEIPGSGSGIPKEFPGNGSRIPPEFPGSSPGDVPALCPDPGGPTWGSLSLLVLLLLLLLLSGVSVLLLLVQATAKEPGNGNGNRKERSCRVPIQEEQMDPNSSLIKN